MRLYPILIFQPSSETIVEKYKNKNHNNSVVKEFIQFHSTLSFIAFPSLPPIKTLWYTYQLNAIVVPLNTPIGVQWYQSTKRMFNFHSSPTSVPCNCNHQHRIAWQQIGIDGGWREKLGDCYRWKGGLMAVAVLEYFNKITKALIPFIKNSK